METPARQPHLPVRLLLTAVLGVSALFAVGAGSAEAATSASLNPTKGCDLAVINDWADNGRVDHIYAIPCYTQALQRLSKYPDVEGYSSAADDIRNALLAAIRQDRGGGPGGPTGSSSSPSGGSSGGSSGSGGSSSSDSGPIPSAIDKGSPSSATSIPLPLIVLAALAGLLLLTAGGTWLARRIQARRMTPAPAPARRP
jgi:hypothetical protein